MRYTESKKFTFSRPPTGDDIVDLIKGHALFGWALNIERRHVGMTNISLEGYVYDVIFEKGRE